MGGCAGGMIMVQVDVGEEAVVVVIMIPLDEVKVIDLRYIKCGS